MTLRILGEWAVILTLAAIGYWAESWIVWCLVCLLVSTRQHALVLLAHEAVHGRGNRLGAALIFWPLFLSFSGYRREHAKHHAHLGTRHDPEPALWRSGLGLFARLHRAGYITSRGLTAFAITAVLTPWWHISLVLLLPHLLVFRYRVEHYRVPRGHTRTFIGGPLTRLLLFPLNVGYHTTHHENPKLSYRELPAVHDFTPGSAAYTTHGFRELRNEWRAAPTWGT